MKAHDVMLRSIDYTPARCRSCRTPIVWAITAKNGKAMPLNSNARSVVRPLAGAGFAISSDHVHWATCPSRAHHRRDDRTLPSERID